MSAENTIAVLASFFWEHGLPLVLKSDNGSSFIARDTGDILAARGILHLRSHAAVQRLVRGCRWQSRENDQDQAALAAHPSH
ncbi:transposase family protein [Planctomycetota bacterium]